MPLYPGEPATVWMRSIKYHTYLGVPQPEGAFYLAHADMVETIESVLKFAVRDKVPPKAVRPAVITPTVPTRRP